MTAPAPHHHPPRRRPPRRRPPRWLVAALLVVAGIAVLLYPVLATWNNNRAQAQFARRYNQQVEQASPDRLAAALRRAHAYDATLRGIPILDPYLQQVEGSSGSPAYREYLSQLGDFDVMARVRVPSVGIDLPVRHGTQDDTLARGAGHLYGTSLPVGGKGTHAVLTSHTGMASATLFDHLHDVRVGARIEVDVYGEHLAYEVDRIRVVLPTEIGDLHPVAGEDLLTLFTCTPYAVNTHRLLVRAHRVPWTGPADAADAAPGGPGVEPWMYALLAGAGAGSVLLVVIVVRERRRR